MKTAAFDSPSPDVTRRLVTGSDTVLGNWRETEAFACYDCQVNQPLPLDEAIQALKRDPSHPVRVRVDEHLTVEVRAVPGIGREPRALAPGEQSAADVFREIGPWEGETPDELLEFLAEARRRGGSRSVPDL